MNQTDKSNLEVFAGIVEEVIFLFDVNEKRFLEINSAFEKIWEISAQTIKDSPEEIIRTIYPDDQRFLIQKFDEIKKGEVKKDLEFRIVLPDNTIKWVFLTAYVLRNATTFTIAGYCRDISDQKEYLFQLLKINSKKNSTMEILAHDLAGPLAMIQNLVQLIETKGKLKEESLSAFTGLIKETCKRSIALITEFVNQEFMESAEIALKKDRVDLVERIGSVINHYKMTEEYLQKKFLLIANAEKIWIELDDVKFMQVVNNLISNAIKFTHDDGEIKVILEGQGEKILITIEDNGIGIPEELHPFLFDKFTKARRPGIRGEKTIGLGMSIIKTIVELHSGEIWFETKENSGTKFYIQLAAKQS